MARKSAMKVSRRVAAYYDCTPLSVLLRAVEVLVPGSEEDHLTPLDGAPTVFLRHLHLGLTMSFSSQVLSPEWDLANPPHCVYHSRLLDAPVES